MAVLFDHGILGHEYFIVSSLQTSACHILGLLGAPNHGGSVGTWEGWKVGLWGVASDTSLMIHGLTRWVHDYGCSATSC